MNLFVFTFIFYFWCFLFVFFSFFNLFYIYIYIYICFFPFFSLFLLFFLIGLFYFLFFFSHPHTLPTDTPPSTHTPPPGVYPKRAHFFVFALDTVDCSGQPVLSAAQRRKQRRLRSWWRHEQQSIALAFATAHHHSNDRKGKTKVVECEGVEEAGSETYYAPRGPKTLPPGTLGPAATVGYPAGDLSMAARAPPLVSSGGSAVRRRERRLRSFWRHEQMAIQMALATVSHHTFQMGTAHDAPRNQKPVTSAGGMPPPPIVEGRPQERMMIDVSPYVQILDAPVPQVEVHALEFFRRMVPLVAEHTHHL